MLEQPPKIPGLRKLETMADLLAKKPLEVDARLCVRGRFRQYDCRRCVNVCAGGAVAFADKPGRPVQVDFTLCNGCGGCVTACPTGVFDYVEGLTDFDLLRKMALSIKGSDSGELYLACRLVPAAIRENAIEVTCFARLHEALLVGAARFEATKVWLINAGCAGCELDPQGAIAPYVQAVAGMSKALGLRTEFVLTDYSKVASLSAGAALIEKEQPTRRELLEGMAAFFKTTTASWAETRLAPLAQFTGQKQVREDKGLVYHVPQKRKLLLGLVKDLKSHAKVALPALPLRDVAFDSAKCNLCGDCALFCPTTAMAMENHDYGSHLVFYPGYCVGCGLCEPACRHEAISLTATVAMNDLIKAHGRALKSAKMRFECAICGIDFAGSKPTALCPTCCELRKLSGGSDEDIEMMDPIPLKESEVT